MDAAWRVQTVRDAEARAMAGMADGALMQRAAAGLASVLVAELKDRRGKAYAAQVLFVVGPGNNGGDGLWAAVRLAHRGVRVFAWRTAGTVHAEGWAAFRTAGGREVDAVGALALLPDIDLVVDAVLGIGGRPGLTAPVATFAAACRDAQVPVVAVDLPSGLDADSGQVTECFSADVTATFGGLKFCQVIQPARDLCGAVQVIDIGLDFPATPDLGCWTPSDVAAVWPVPTAAMDKYARGVVGIDAGSPAYPGAGVLATTGAVFAGAGMVRYLGADEVFALVRQSLPSVVRARGQVQAWVLGCGWGDRPDGTKVVAEVIDHGLPVVLDADALRYLPQRACGAQVVLTPHAGELARLLGVTRREVEADPIAAVRAAVQRTGATVLLKGATQFVLGPRDACVRIAVGGPAWTAQAGSGDTLAGMCGTLLAAGLDPADAALAAASMQAMLAARHPGPIPPDQLIRQLPALIGSARAV